MTTKKAPSSTSASRISGLGDQITDIGGKVGNLYLKGYEKSIHTVVGMQRRAATRSKSETVQTVLDAQADLVSGIGEATVSASRKIIS